MIKLTRTNFSIKQLTDMYTNGEIAIPEIQRDFVWDAKRIRLLIDSIQNDFPSGAVILWRPEFRMRDEFEMLIRPERLHLYKERLPTYLLLDGQQRLTALCSVILHADQVMSSLGEEITLPKLFINLRTLAIEARNTSISSSNNEILLNRILSEETTDSGLSSVLGEISLRKDITLKHKNNLKEFREKILQYTYPVQILENHDYATVANIFKRVNSQGKILVTAELELATIVPHWKGFSKHLRTFIREMRSAGLNADMPFYMKCLAFIATDWPSIDSFSRAVVKGDLSIKQLERHWKTTKKSIRKLHFLLKKNKIDRTEFITTRNAMVPMVYAIAKDKKNRIGDALFIKWLIFSMVGGHYTKQTEGVLRKDSYYLTNSLPNIENGFLKLYRQMFRKDITGSTFFRDIDFEGSAAKNPAMLLMYLGLRHNGARDFSGKNAIPIEQISKYQIHHIFPIEFMLADENAEKYRKGSGLSRPEFKEEINDVTNLTFISLEANQEIKKRPPFDYLSKLTTPKNLEAHCIPTDPELWKPENFGAFFDERRRLLAKAINAYLRHLE
jgi:hypothetical protein